MRKKLTERKLLQGLSVSFREEEEHEQDLDDNPDAIRDVVFPCKVLEADGVDELVEEASDTDPDLEDRDTLCATVVREQLDQEGCDAFEIACLEAIGNRGLILTVGQGVEADGVGGRI